MVAEASLLAVQFVLSSQIARPIIHRDRVSGSQDACRETSSVFALTSPTLSPPKLSPSPPLNRHSVQRERLEAFRSLRRSFVTGCPGCAQGLGAVYQLPHHLKYAHRVRLISDDSHAGRHFHAHLSADGMPDELAELGFRSLSDLWPPWCVALVDGKAASVAFAARIAETGAELGVAR